MSEPFSEEDPKWQCCCGCHVVTGSKIIGWVALISSIVTVIGAAGSLIMGSNSRDQYEREFDAVYGSAENDPTTELLKNMPVITGVSSLVGEIIGLLFAALLLYGVTSSKRMLMIPYMIVLGIAAIISIVTIVGAIFLGWLWYILYCCFQYIGLKETNTNYTQGQAKGQFI